jgi:hypothetical protein
MAHTQASVLVLAAQKIKRGDKMGKSMNIECTASRNHLLATVSSMVLICSVCCSGPASADEQPAVWIEFDGSIGNVQDTMRNIDLPLGPMVPGSGFTGPLVGSLDFARVYTNDAKITFQPDNSDWVFSASIRYGRSRAASKISQALASIPTTSFTSYQFTYPLFPSSNKTRVRPVAVSREKLNGDTSDAESHFILDFDAGKDVGLGMFGHGSTSVVSAGVRFAHFAASRQVAGFQQTQGIGFQTSYFRTYRWPGYGTRRRELWDTISASGSATSRFKGLGPSIQWEASARLWGNEQGGLSLDWGANAAILFGKQEKKIHYQSSSEGHCAGSGCPAHFALYTNASGAHDSRTVAVPNIGGFAGLSFKVPKAKFSVGYRADLFVNAIDVGLASRKSSNLLFHGPYASISIGVGD